VKQRIVAIDTTSEFGSIALVEDGRTVEELLLHSPDGFAHILFPQLQRLMDRHGWKHCPDTGYVAAAGPGSFTGVRVGIAAIKGLAEAAGAKAGVVSSLKAVASFGTAPLRAPLLDARRGEVYAALFDSGLRLKSPEVVACLPHFLSSLPETGVEFLTPTPYLLAHATQTPRALAAALARLGASHLADPITLDANYVRRSDAELKWSDR
jgi:tRNA threonylcarbamoyladenosine biosynthesis protein TsaB